MTVSAEERGQLLAPHLDQAQQAVAGLETAIKAAEARAHDFYVRGDVSGGDGAHAEAARLKPQLEAARARLATFHEAADVVAGQKHREALESQLARVSQAEADAVAEAQRQAAEVRPAMSAAKMALRRALAEEDRARSLEAERYELEVGLGQRERGRFTPLANAVRAALEARPDWQRLLHDPEL